MEDSEKSTLERTMVAVETSPLGKEVIDFSIPISVGIGKKVSKPQNEISETWVWTPVMSLSQQTRASIAPLLTLTCLPVKRN